MSDVLMDKPDGWVHVVVYDHPTRGMIVNVYKYPTEGKARTAVRRLQADAKVSGDFNRIVANRARPLLVVKP